MLTNIKKTLYIIMLSLFIVSCSNENDTNNVTDNKENIVTDNKEVINISGEKSKALGGKAKEEGSINASISDGVDTEAPQKPDFIK